MYYVVNYNNVYTVNYNIKIIQNDGRGIGEIYYSDTSSYHPKYRKEIQYKNNTDSFQKIRVNIYNIDTIRTVRLDPLLSSGLVEIKNFTISYLDQIYNIDFPKVTKYARNNIDIIVANKEKITLQCTGLDPFLELSHTVHFNQINVHNIGKALLYTIGCFILLLLVVYAFLYSVFQASVLFSVLFIYTGYTLVYLSPGLATQLLILFAFVSVLLTCFKSPANIKHYLKHMGMFGLLYVLIGYLSLHFTTEMANANYYEAKIPYILLAIIIPLGFYNLHNFNVRLFKIMLTALLVFMAVMIILLDHNILSIHNIPLFNIMMERTNWTQKNYMFWYVLLMFGTLAFYALRKKSDLFMVLSILVLSYFVVFGGYSLSARLSYGVGVLTYILLSLFHIKKSHLFIIIWGFTFYIIFSPIIFALIDFTFLPKLVNRDAMYKTALALIKEHWIFGYGYGSTLTLQIKDFVSDANLPEHFTDHFRGGHPHNLSLLFWLEFGVVGASFLAYYIHKLLAYIIENTYSYTNQAAILSLVVAFDVITSFSWSIWYPQVLLTFAFFGIMLVLSLNVKVKREKGIRWLQN